MKKGRRKFGSAFKSRVEIEALKERQTLSELAIRFELQPNQLMKARIFGGCSVVFE